MTLETSADDVVTTFKVTPAATREFDTWRNNPGQRHVTDFVMGHVTRALYDVRPADVQAVAARSRHPLGNIRSIDAKRVAPMADWRPDFAFVHVLHYALEAAGMLLTYQDFQNFCLNDSRATMMLVEPARAEVAAISRRDDCDSTESEIWDAFIWRIGLVYYSFLREVYTLAVLRANGLDVRAHPLADAVFRTDAWIGRTVVSLFIGNSEFRNGAEGRKKRPEELLGGADTAFTFKELRLDIQHKFGRVHMPVDEQIRRLGWTVLRDASLDSARRTA